MQEKGIVHIVDDDQPLRLAVQSPLFSTGYAAITSRTSAAAIDAAPELPGRVLFYRECPRLDAW